jgi:hypothetical protein
MVEKLPVKSDRVEVNNGETVPEIVVYIALMLESAAAERVYTSPMVDSFT